MPYPECRWEYGPQVEVKHFGVCEVFLGHFFHDDAYKDIGRVISELGAEEEEMASQPIPRGHWLESVSVLQYSRS